MAVNIVWDVLVTYIYISWWALLCEPFTADHVENEEMTIEDPMDSLSTNPMDKSNKIKAITNTRLRV